MKTKLNVSPATNDILEKIIDTVPNYAILLLDHRGRIKTWNKGALFLTGYTAEEVMDKNFGFLYNALSESIYTPYALLTKAQQDGYIRQKSWIMKKDGIQFWADSTLTAIQDTEEEITELLLIIKDLSSEKKDEDKLSELSERLRLATDASKTGIWDWDLATNTFIWDDQMYELYGVSRNSFDVTLDALKSKVHPEDLEKMNTGLELALRQKKEINLDFRIVLDDKSIRHIRMLAKVYCDKAGNAIRIVGTNMDITPFVKADEKFKNLLEAAPDAMIIVNENGFIEIANSQAETLFEFTRQELIGKTIEMIMPETFRAAHVKHRHNFFESPVRRPMGEGRKLSAQSKSGKIFPVEISLSPIESEKGTWVSAAIRDITKRIETEDTLRKYSTLESKSKEMEQFAYIASHDLREPLLTIKNYIQLIHSKQEKFAPQTRHYLETVAKAADRMEKLIIGLLDYSRLSKRKQLLPVDCNQLVKEIIQDLHASIISSGAKVTFESLPTIKAYPLELKLLFQNLIANGIKFSKKDIAPIIHLSASKISNGWQFKIHDNGIGIDELHKEKIFDIFQKLHSSAEYEGTGIGLAHCRKIAEIHGGTIWVQSKLNEYSSFYFTILTDNL